MCEQEVPVYIQKGGSRPLPVEPTVHHLIKLLRLSCGRRCSRAFRSLANGAIEVRDDQVPGRQRRTRAKRLGNLIHWTEGVEGWEAGVHDG